VSAYGESAGDYWPTWRGPDATGAASKGNPPVTWSETQNIKWKVKVPGKGSSSPVIWGDRIFFQTAIRTDRKGTISAEEMERRENRPVFEGVQVPRNIYKFDLVCLDRNTGRILWQKTAREEMPHEGHHPSHGFASYSPVTDGAHVWASFGSRGLHCYDVDGNHKWSVDLGRMTIDDAVGEGSSPALAGDAAIVVMDHEAGSSITAVNKETGEKIWRKDRDEPTSWPTPLTVEVDGQLEVVTSAPNRVRSYDAKTGDVIWECEGLQMNAIPSPVSGFGKVFCTSGFRDNILEAIELGRTGDLTGTDAISWRVNEATPYIPSPLLYGDKLYVCWGNRPVISCYQAETGKANFVKQRLEGLKEIYASPVGAADRVYFVGREGKTAVIKRSEKLEVLAVNTLDDEIDASPAVVGDELFLKGKTHFYCIAEP
jgi:outer membrane protein assembly factor BamB